MSDVFRLLHYARRYWGRLLVSVVLMAGVGVSQALTALLIGPIFDRVLNPKATSSTSTSSSPAPSITSGPRWPSPS